MFTRKPGAEPPAWAGELVLRFVGARGSYPVLDREGAQIASLPAAELLDLLPRSDPHGGAGEEVPAEADRLFATVFHGEVLTRLESARTAASTTQARVRLTIDLAGAAELEDVAWELLGVSGLAPAMEVVRSVGTLARGDRDLVRPIDILAVLPNGSDNHLEAERGWHHLHTAVKAFCNDGAASLTRLPSARMSDIEKALAGQAFQVLHFIGSGRSEPGSQNGTVVLESETGGPRKVTAEYFPSRLDAYPPLQLVVLEPNDSHCGVNPFAMTARTLVSGRRSAVVALRRPLTGSPTGAWAGPLYASLAGGNSIDRGVTAARRALARGGAGQDWASPMLYAIPGALGEPQPAADEPAQDGPAVVAAGGTGTPPEDELAALRDVRKVTCTRPPAPPESEEPAPPAEQPVRPLRPPITGRLPLWGRPVPPTRRAFVSLQSSARSTSSCDWRCIATGTDWSTARRHGRTICSRRSSGSGHGSCTSAGTEPARTGCALKTTAAAPSSFPPRLSPISSSWLRMRWTAWCSTRVTRRFRRRRSAATSTTSSGCAARSATSPRSSSQPSSILPWLPVIPS